MQLKRIEIAGFKSFAEKTTIEFHEGVTAVVGPNGSGKSNITEAIRWVLGEQSAKSLRGGKMNDIIFAGSETRKPLNVAEVTLVLENEDHFLPLDFSEINVTRRLHRNGDSEFYLNKQACRLKDIVDLFMDSGLGKESFSIISQGKVEAIFNSKPEDRRAIFEEAAGVFKYKTRKKKAEQKLVETEDNLNRVQDIVYELDGQIEPLQMQSSIAKDYLMQKEQLSDVEIALTAVEIEQLKDQWTTHKSKLTAFYEQLSKKKTTYAELEKKSKKMKLQKQQLTEILDSEQQQLVKTIQQYEQLEGQKQVLNERSKHTQENRDHYEMSKQQALIKIEKLEEQLQQLKILLDKKINQQKELRTELETAEKERMMFSANSKETIEQLRNQYVDLMQQKTSLRNEQSYLEKTYNQVAQKTLKSKALTATLEAEFQQVSKQLESSTGDVAQIQQEIAQKLLHYQEQQITIQEKRTALEQKEQMMYDALRVVQQAKAKKESLQELRDDYAGFYQGVKEVLKQRVQIGGIIGAVAELIVVPKTFEMAIDIALGAASQNVIVKDELSGRKAIQYLKQKRSGRATFLPLTTIKPRQLPVAVENQAKQHEGFMGIASEMVQYPAEISHIIQNILGTTILAKDLQTANDLAKTLQFKYRVVTLEGDVINAGGSMTGGASKKGNQGSLFSRKNELELLTKQISQMEKTLTDKEIEVRGFKQVLKQAQQNLEDLRETGEQQRLKEQELKNQAEINEEKLSRLQRELKAYQFESEEAKAETEQYEQRTAAITLELAAIQTEMEQINHQIELASSQNEERAALQAEASEKVQRLMTQLATIKEQVANLKKEQLALKSQLEIENQELNKLQLAIQQMSQTDGSHQLSQKEIMETLSKLKKQKDSLDHSLAVHQNQRTELETDLEQLEQEMSLKQNQQQYVMEQITKEEVALNRDEVAIESRLTYLNEEYHLSFEAAKSEHTLVISMEEAAHKVKLLKQSIEELGNVNVGAIEEFERVNERYLFLVEQRDDLLEAKSSLYETMDEMDEEVKRRFSESFEAIRARFSVVFPQMFGGGTAELQLTDPMNLLTTGIEIVAQPPGKKLQQLSLLSGGERAFTAIALLFSIIQVRPVPFCILDEVEAALDEANVVRFGRYLRRFEGDTQFIVITHRKGTMEEANVLYGVTMQESGVSKIVSVRLEEAETKEHLPLG